MLNKLLYHTEKVLDSDDILHLLTLYDEDKLDRQNTIAPGGVCTRFYKKLNLSRYGFADISEKIKSMVEIYNENPLDYEGYEIHILRYEVGDFFAPHLDNNSERLGRVFSTSTLLRKTDDLVGGDLVVGPQNVPIKQEVGDTVLFRSGTRHGVTRVEKGTRWTLVVWFYGCVTVEDTINRMVLMERKRRGEI